MRILLFGLIFSSVFILLNLYIYRRFIQKLDLSLKAKNFLKLFLIINFLGIVGYMNARYYINIPSWLYYLLSLPIGVVFLLFFTAVIYDISRLFITLVPMKEGRRKFFKRSLDISSLVAATALSGRAMYEARHVEVEKINIKIDRLKKSFKIAQVSDLHIGGVIGKEFIGDVVKKVNAIDADIVVITGDLVDLKMSEAMPIVKELTKMRSRYGIHYIVGNHEYFHGIAEILEGVKSLGFNVLQNGNVYIGEAGLGFNLAGVYDVFGYRSGSYEPDIQLALNNIDTSSPTVLLAHQPRFIDEVPGDVDLMLSGHTHGGQIYPFGYLTRLVQPYIRGLHQHTKKLQIYVNKGTGFWGPPMRLGANAEITDITLEPA